MKRGIDTSPGSEAKKAKPGSEAGDSELRLGAAPVATLKAAASAARAVTAALLAHSPALTAPPPRLAWGLDRLVLDDRFGEEQLRSLLQAGGSDLPETIAGRRRGPGASSALRCRAVLSLPGGVGQGIAAGVGLAIGQMHLAATFDQSQNTLFRHRVFVVCRGGALPSGVASESCSLAGHLRLGSLVVVCCEDGEIGTEDTSLRYQSYGWSVQHVSGCDELALLAALEATRTSEQPTLIMVRTVESSPSASSVDRTEDCTGWVSQGAAAASAWLEQLKKFGESHAEEHAEIERRFSGKLPENWREGFPEYHVGERAQATRQYSAKVLGTLAAALPEMIGGSADLTGSNLTNQAQLKDFQHNRNKGRYLRFGVRESAMIGICTGLAAYGGFIPFCSTFMNFFTYGWGALRLASKSLAHVIYVATHDSIELGEDGPTHQPIEVLAACRALPNLLTLRPCDGPETIGAYEVAMRDNSGPALLALCRSGAHTLEGSSAENVARGGYILQDYDPALVPAVVLAASGTEVEICAETRALLQSIGVGARIVSLPCWELFEEQDAQYRQSMWQAPNSATSGVPPMRVYVEASSTLGFHRYAEVHVGMTSFGASADGKIVRKHFGFEKNAIALRVMEALKDKGHILSYRIGRFGFCKFGAAIGAATTQ